MTRTELIAGSNLFPGLAGPWRELSASSNATPFQTYEWQSVWLNHYGTGKNPAALAVYEGNDLIGLAPFVIGAGTWRTVRWIGGGPSDYLHPLAKAGYETQVAGATSQFLREMNDVDLIDLHQVRENQPLAEAYQPSLKIEQATSLLLDLPTTFDDYLKLIGKSLRYDVRKLDKELFKSGKAKMETIPVEEIDRGFDIFLEQHKARWRERRLPGAFVGKSLQFHREWIRLGVEKGLVRLKILRVDGVPAGAIYAMSTNGVLYYYQAGFDPNFKAISPGTLLVADCIREGIEEGMARFDFMRGDEPYKRRWKPQNVIKNLRFLDSRTRVRGKAGLNWNRRAHELEMKIRARLEGGSLI